MEAETLQRALSAMADQRASLDRTEAALIEHARSQGMTWEQIGECYGISRQAARQRFLRPRKRRTT